LKYNTLYKGIKIVGVSHSVVGKIFFQVFQVFQNKLEKLAISKNKLEKFGMFPQIRLAGCNDD
jgi:hypothetical protein